MPHGADRVRPEWRTLPSTLRARVIDEIGGTLVEDEPAQGGFGAGYAGIVRTTSGRAFVKAVSSTGHAESLRLLRQEMRVLRDLPRAVAPRMRVCIDDGAGAALVIDPIDGEHPGTPWTDEELHAIAAAIAALAVTPAPMTLPAAAEVAVPRYARWHDIAKDDSLAVGLPQAIANRLPTLVEIEDGFAAAIAGDVIMHNDLRADNILLSGGDAHLLDWPHALRAAPWADLPVLLPSIESGGGPRCEDAWRIFEMHGAPRPEALLPIAVGFASFLWHGQAQPEIPELPGLRGFQRAQADAALRWLGTML